MTNSLGMLHIFEKLHDDGKLSKLDFSRWDVPDWPEPRLEELRVQVIRDRSNRIPPNNDRVEGGGK